MTSDESSYELEVSMKTVSAPFRFENESTPGEHGDDAALIHTHRARIVSLLYCKTKKINTEIKKS